MKKIFLAILGVVFILLGIVGLFLPFLQGFLFIFIGLSLIAPRFAERLKHRFFRRFFKQDIIWLDSWKKSSVQAGFTTKHFGLFLSKTDDLLKEENQETLKKLFAVNKDSASHGFRRQKSFVFLNQVHGDTVAVLEDPSQYPMGRFFHLAQTDAVITHLRDLVLMVLTADCLPIFLQVTRNDAASAEWVGLVHAGWRGTDRKIAKKACQLLIEKSSAHPGDIRVIFGPCIGKKHYEVGREFSQYFPRASLSEKNNRLYFDLAGENKRQLRQIGIPEKNILDLGICTVEENESFYSFRRQQDKAGRMISFIVK